MLQFIDFAQIEIYDLNSYMNQTKPDPILETTGETLSYTLDDEVKSVTRVYTKRSDVSYVDDRNSYSYDNSIDRKRSVDCFLTEAKSITASTGNSIVLFHKDPGTTDDVYYLEQYEWPDELTAESIPLSVDEVTARTYLKYLVYKNIEEAGYATSIYNDDQAEKAKKAFLRRVKKPRDSFTSNKKNKIKGGGC
jgi:hypothetical protein